VGNELVARGVQMEAYSIEDEGDGICYNVYCFNVQPGITINYLDGSSALSGTNAEPNPNPDEDDSTSDESKTEDNSKEETPAKTYALNTNTKKFHDPDCSSAKKISDKNYAETTESRDSLIAKGYSPCGICKP
jgi:DNA-entry nuclease